MSHQQRLRRVRRWARYFNHYGHISDVFIGGRAAHRLVWMSWETDTYSFMCVRRQAKHRFGEKRGPSCG